MAVTKSKKSRKGLAVALAVLGVAGLSLASASQLTLTGSPQLQAGVKDVAGCQSSSIAVAFTTPTIATGSTEYKSAGLTLTAFDAACTTAGAKFKVALLDSTGTVVQETTAANVVTGAATVTLTTATPANIAKVAVTIFS
jgi:hypothetical protein